MESELLSLRAELALLERDNQRRLETFERRLSALETQLQRRQVEQPVAVVELEDELTLLMGKPPETPGTSEQIQPAAISTAAAPPQLTPSQVHSTSKKTDRPPVSTEWLQEGLTSLLAPALEPLNRAWEPLAGFYRHYQRQGKAPVFFMTAAGILALVFGFAYLLQLSFNAYLGPAGKVTLGFLIAAATTFGGVTFSRRIPHMADYGSGLIALGVILLYLCGYFAGPYYQLVPIPVGVGLLVVTTGLSYLLALLFQTRVVSMVTLLGGATMPLIANHFDPSAVIYLSYLLALALAMLHLSRQIRWPQLAMVTMALSAGMFEYSISNLDETAATWGPLLILHGFFYGFAHYALRWISTEEIESKGLEPRRLVIIAANLVLFIHISWSLAPSTTAVGVVWLLNLLPWIALALYSRRLFGYSTTSDSARVVQNMALLHGGLLAGLAILALCGPALLGVVWCLEGLLLIFLGARFGFISVRSEGYIALAIAGLTMLWQAIAWVASGVAPAPVLLSLNADAGWGNWLALCAAAFGLTHLLRHCADQITPKERDVAALADDAFGLFLSASFLLSIGIFWPQGMWLLALFPMGFFIWRGQRNGSVFSEWLGLSHYLLLFIPLLASASIVGNFHFYDQIPYGKIAGIEAFLSLWLLAALYQRLEMQSHGFTLALNLRKLFYALLPVFFLPTVLHKASDYFPIAMWLSCAIALLLYSHLRLALLKQELRILVAGASLVALFGCALREFENWQGMAMSGLLLGLITLAGFLWIGRGLQQKPLGPDWQLALHQALKPIFPLAFYYLAATLFIISYALSRDFGLALLLSQLYFASLYIFKPKLAPLRNQLMPFYMLSLRLFEFITLLQVVAVVTNSSKAPLLGLYNLTALGIATLLVYRRFFASRAVWPGRRLFNLWVLHLTAIPVYIALLAQLLETMWLPAISFALVVHATLLLFQTLKPDTQKLLKLSLLLFAMAALKIVLWDMQDFSLIQKIVVCMLVGLCMLGAAFQYQKFLSRSSLPQ
ncbi:DUF2339 domain-containing protein [uncultured Microbulbifer sp.]|uniref:DUF2339 domain-containing protein n=1 Tax=uncultured Microbulbifer sp. TaxID=348147 RepID=UPI002619791C|nr:DUF2339 domain-containing protein [uncultured Microbulbifer sp.]